MNLRAVLLAALCLTATTAHADMLALGEKGVKLSIQVDMTVPAGKTLILANTFRGADVLAPNAVNQVEWHPLGGELQLKLVASADADKLAPLRDNLDRDTIKPIVDRGLACGSAFPGVRTISETSPAEEVRWTYRASVTGTRCSAELVKTEYLDAAGKPVAAPGNTDIPPPSPPSPPDLKPVPPPAPAPTEPPVKADAKPEPSKTDATKPAAKAESGCRTATAPAPAGLAALLLGLLLRRRRR